MRPEFKSYCSLLPSFLHFTHQHLWNTNSVPGVFSALAVDEKSNPSFAPARLAWVPSDLLLTDTETPVVKVMRIQEVGHEKHTVHCRQRGA